MAFSNDLKVSHSGLKSSPWFKRSYKVCRPNFDFEASFVFDWLRMKARNTSWKVSMSPVKMQSAKISLTNFGLLKLKLSGLCSTKMRSLEFFKELFRFFDVFALSIFITS